MIWGVPHLKYKEAIVWLFTQFISFLLALQLDVKRSLNVTTRHEILNHLALIIKICSAAHPSVSPFGCSTHILLSFALASQFLSFSPSLVITFKSPVFSPHILRERKQQWEITQPGLTHDCCIIEFLVYNVFLFWLLYGSGFSFCFC